MVAGFVSIASGPAAQARPVGSGHLLVSPALTAGAELVVAYLVVYGLLITVVPFPLFLFFDRREKRTRPELELTVGLLQLLSRLDKNDPPWETAAAKQSHMYSLRRFSSEIERSVPRTLRSQLRRHDEWRSSVARQQADYIRDLCRWLTLPMENTRGEFRREIAQLARCILNDDWHHLPRATAAGNAPPADASLHDRVAWGLANLRRLLIAALPVLVFAALHFLEHGAVPDWLQLRPEELPDLIRGAYPYAKTALLVAGVFRVTKLADPTLVQDFLDLFDPKRFLQGPRADR
jgi:hypothetical protein